MHMRRLGPTSFDTGATGWCGCYYCSLPYPTARPFVNGALHIAPPLRTSHPLVSLLARSLSTGMRLTSKEDVMSWYRCREVSFPHFARLLRSSPLPWFKTQNWFKQHNALCSGVVEISFEDQSPSRCRRLHPFSDSCRHPCRASRAFFVQKLPPISFADTGTGRAVFEVWRHTQVLCHESVPFAFFPRCGKSCSHPTHAL